MKSLGPEGARELQGMFAGNVCGFKEERKVYILFPLQLSKKLTLPENGEEG